MIDEPVSLRDLPATILDQMGASIGSSFPGRSLARLWVEGGEAHPSSDIVLSEIEAPPDDDPNRGESPASRGPMTSIVDRDYHYIRGGDGREELYDLRRDPAEVHDLARSPETVEALKRFRARLPGTGSGR